MQNPGAKWFLILLCPACFMAILLLYKKSSVEFIFCNSNSYNITKVELPQTTKDLFFLGHSKTEIINLQMSNDEANKNFFNFFLSKRHFACENNLRLGNLLDGGWDICLAEPYRPKPPCLVYSFGINNDFSFDDAVSASFNCTVRCFDPSMTANDHRRSANVWFYKTGIGGENTVNGNGWKLQTLSTIIKSMNDSDVIIDYLKMDVEGSEWPSLTKMLLEGTLSKVKQFGIELHIGAADTKSLFSIYNTLKKLEDQGFRRWYYSLNLYHVQKTPNGFRSCCYEMVYINTNFLK